MHAVLFIDSSKAYRIFDPRNSLALFGVPTPTVDGARRFGWPDSFRENGELWFERAHIAPHDSWESRRLLFGFTGITAGAAAIAKFLFGLSCYCA